MMDDGPDLDDDIPELVTVSAGLYDQLTADGVDIEQYVLEKAASICGERPFSIFPPPDFLGTTLVTSQ